MFSPKKKKDPTSFFNQMLQFLGGTGAATTYVLGLQPQSLRDVEPTDETRKKFGQMLDEREGEGAEWTQYEQQMMKGQNGAQTLLDQTMPETTIPLFQKQLDHHLELDERGAPDFEHHDINIDYHDMLSKEFGKQGYWSGKYLHKIGKKQAQFGKWMTHPETAKQFDEFMEKGGGGY